MMKKEMRLNFLCGLCVALIGTSFGVQAQEKTAQEVLREQYSKNREQVEEIFKQKIDKIRERTALPEKMRALLIRQADEMREFDIYTLDRKLEMKIRQMGERDKIKNELKKELYEKEVQVQEARENARERGNLNVAGEPAAETAKKEVVEQVVAPVPPKNEAPVAEPVKKDPVAETAPVPAVLDKPVVEKDMGAGTLTHEK